MSRPRVLLLTGYGINCEEELSAAFRLAGAGVDRVHIGRILRGEVELHAYSIIGFPGGFSFGDDLGAGRVLANRIRSRPLPHGATLLERLVQFLDNGGHLLGICNGFQVLVTLGLLPNVGGDHRQEVALAANLSARYEDRWVRLAADARAPHPALAELGDFEAPVRHAEGRLVFRDQGVRQAVVDRHLNCLTYVDADGLPAIDFPANPNGAALSCAGLCDPTGRVLGLMPHPEAYLSLYNHYDWPRKRRENPDASEDGEGIRLFRALVATVHNRPPGSGGGQEES